MSYNSQKSSFDGTNSQEFIMDGVNTYTKHDEYSKVISFETKNGTEIVLYTIMCSANSPDIEEAKKQFNIVIKSLKVNQKSVMS